MIRKLWKFLFSKPEPPLWMIWAIASKTIRR